MQVSYTVFGNRNPAGQLVKITDDRRRRCFWFSRTIATEIGVTWASNTRSRRVANAIRVERFNKGAHTVVARAGDVGLNPEWVEYDTVIPLIRATKPHGLLVFKNEHGEIIRTKKPITGHPGTKGDHALARAIDAHRDEYREGLAKIWGGS